MANKYSKALKHLKNKNIDEKLELLSEVPTNNTSGLYVDVPGQEIVPPREELLPRSADLDEDGDGAEGYTGNDTTGLFLTDGTILLEEPPGDTSYILGPMMSMWYAWANYTQVGYVRQSDRKMVNLGRITGEMSAWDGETGFTGYGQMSIDQVVWFKGQPRADYRAFYPGPPSNPADQYGRYTGSMVSTAKPTSYQPPDRWNPGTNKGFDASDDLSLLLKNKETNDKNRSDEIARMALNALMLGLDIAAVVALLFPEPASSAAGAVHLATKFRYIAKLRRFRGALNPFGQRAVRSGAAGRVRRQVYSGRPYQGKRGFGKTTYGTTNRATARTYSNPGPLKGTPGTGSRVNPRGTVDTGTLPQRYIDKYGSRSVLGQKQVKLGPKAAKRTFGEDFEYILEQINKMKLLETATAVPSLSGGTEAADGYVDKVSETSSPEELEQASNDANGIAKEGGRGLSDSDLAKIDKDAEAEAKRLTNFNIDNPESMDDDQLNASTEMMYEIDPDWVIESFNRNESLIDTVKLDKLYNEYTERRSYIGSLEHGFSISPEFKRYYNNTEYINKTYISQITFVDGYYNSNGRQVPYVYAVNKNTGERIGGDDFLQKKIGEFVDSFNKTWDTFNSKTVRDRTNKDREENDNNYRKQSDILFRPFYIQIIREWSQRGADINDDPFGIKDYINQQGGIQNMSEADKKRLKSYLSKMGVSYGDIASADAMSLGVDATAAVIGLGVAGLVTLYNITTSAATELINAISTTNSGSDYNSPPGRTRNLGPGESLSGTQPKVLTPQQQAEVDAAGNELRDARRALNDLPADATDTQKDMAQERVDKAEKRRQSLRKKNKTDNQNRKESYDPPKFLKNRERNNIIETRTPKQKRILREIKKPVQVKEIPTKVKVSPKLRNNKSVGVDMMNIPDVPKQYKPPMNMWGKHEYKQNVRRSQEKKNEVLELVGAAEHHWTYMTEDRKKQKQERINEMMAAEFDKQMELLYEKHRIKENKMNKAINAVKKTNDIKPEYPENPPPQPDPETGMHPKYGKRYKHDKLDPHSAEFMPPTGDPEIDANVKKATNAKEKARKLKILFGKKA